MASIFTFEPDPPRVASPWSSSGISTPERPVGHDAGGALQFRSVKRNPWPAQDPNDVEVTVTKLEAEPQDGPTEYKLHLLLRPRRSFCSSTTNNRISGSHRSGSSGDASRKTSETRLSGTPPLASSSQSRQHRLEQLTTQLLWRLQQSSPHHASTPNSLGVSSFPKVATSLGVAPPVGTVIPGLEDSKGALYEIGVADDGTFVGLAQDELDESLHNLRAMAATLGCTVEVLRKVAVGECEWFEDVGMMNKPSRILRKDTLWVAEAFIKPSQGAAVADELASAPMASLSLNASAPITRPADSSEHVSVERAPTEQLRITLTGPTMSGKSTLVGSLTSATLDNGRGKSRLSLLKHRHEIVSGMTSSVTQELLGMVSDESASTRVVNSASTEVASWHDIHASCRGGRLVFMSDSAGHPRYLRTTLRGLVGWAPHWALFCVSADGAEDTLGKSGSTPALKDLAGGGTVDTDLSESHLQICLHLGLPLLVAITKLDLASKTGLRQVLAKLLTTLKAAGRKPLIVPDPAPQASCSSEPLSIGACYIELVRKILGQATSASAVVPIVLASAVNGTGISKLHALLSELPIPHAPSPVIPGGGSHFSYPDTLFYIEDVYHHKANAPDNKDLTVVSGILRFGKVCIGDELVFGPCAVDSAEDPRMPGGQAALPTSRSFPGALSTAVDLEEQRRRSRKEWRRVQVVSIRNLRLPVHCLHADQVGTIGIQSLSTASSPEALSLIRKGMILAKGAPFSSTSLEADFAGKDIRVLSVGSVVVLYAASIRTTAKIIYMAVGDESLDPVDVEDEQFQFDTEDGFEAGLFSPVDKSTSTIVRCRFLTSREFVEPGISVLVLPGGGPGLAGGNTRGEKGGAGLDSFVGKVLRGLNE